MSSSINLENFDMGILSAAEIRIKTFVDENRPILQLTSPNVVAPLEPDALMDLGSTLQLASSILEEIMDTILAIRPLTALELRQWLDRRQCTTDAHTLLVYHSRALLDAEFGSDSEDMHGTH
ncbi:hypothetical protein CYLTODRAFT_460110 [Cylindrobasidium torrendii FP15055 ss-10]|uniref:Uncharacterized protein n=1 Tax=Cylindrobasidium torrendii FP15055 ss-10 TaxID=1314674 RepID=A0A0D7ASZ0_9AGAR|nr:hypothetical protein CYLTODRAFT_460110 [Cylindrobasidium torrendii FP15055 ss-10]